MTTLPDLAVILRAEGVRVRELGLWRVHVRPGAFAPVGNLVHHTADKGRGDTGLDVLRWGRGEPNPLLGPLCNGSPREDGSVVLLSAGRSNHAGRGSQAVLDRILAGRSPGRPGPDDGPVGNGLLYGWEVDNDGVGQRYPEEQIDATVRACAATSRAHGWGPERTILHGEWTRRKTDWSYCSGDELRDLVADRLRAGQDEREDVALTDQDLDRMVAKLVEPVAQRVRQVVADGSQPYGLDNLRRMLVTLLDLSSRQAQAPGSPAGGITRAELDAALEGLPAEVVDELSRRLGVEQ